MTALPNTGAPDAPNVAALLATALGRGDVTPRARAFLLDVKRKASRWPLTEKQVEAVRKIAEAPPRPDYAAINAAALARLPDVLGRLLPGGRIVRGEYLCADLHGSQGESLRVNLRTGRWADFAAPGTKGGSPVDLAAAVTGKPPAEAAHGLSRMLGLGGGV